MRKKRLALSNMIIAALCENKVKRNSYKDEVKEKAMQPFYMNCFLVMNLALETICRYTQTPFTIYWRR